MYIQAIAFIVRLAPMKVVLEACCGSVEEAIVSEAAGADRIELCAALPTGGVTPSVGMIEEARAHLSIPIVAMVRPREGGACPSEPEFRTALRDVKHCIRAGADELIFGVLDASGLIDRERNRALIEAAEGRPVVFHRVFDMTADLFLSLDTLVELGFCRVLTSGGKPSVDEGMFALSELVAHAGERITILPGGGVRAHNARQLVGIGCRELHFSFRKPTGRQGYSDVPDTAPDPDRITEIRSLVNRP